VDSVIECTKVKGLWQAGRKRFTSRVAICIPAYNEAKHLASVLRACRLVEPVMVLVIDDASGDATSRVVAREAMKNTSTPILLLRNEKNLGKQGSVRRGLRALRTAQLDAVALIDGDGQHDPLELPALAALLGEYHFVIGARSRAQMPWQRRLSNRLVNLSYKLIGKVDFVDVQSGLRVYKKEIADVLAKRLPREGGYALEHESLAILAEVARARGLCLRAAAAPISCAYGESKSSMGPGHILQLAGETLRQAARFRKVLEAPAAA
jgi:glycosyltransferase involved in cell wall biosynthesis